MFVFLGVRVTQEAEDDGIVNPLLQQLDQERQQVLQESKAPLTVKAYRLAYDKWVSWAAQFKEVQTMPANSVHVGLYVTNLAKNVSSYSTINQACASIAWAHRIAGFESPTNNVQFIELLSGLKRRLAKPRVPKEPFELAHIKSLIDIVDFTSITDVRNILLIVLAFYAFLRVSELMDIRWSDVLVTEEFLQLYISKSKSDQLRDGNTVVIARIGGKYCPIALLEYYLKIACNSITEKRYLFCKIHLVKGKRCLNHSQCMTYSNIRDIVKSKAEQIGLNSAEFSTHSMRAGGATLAANSGVVDRLFQRHGRWRSVQSKDAYVKDSISCRLSVTKHMK
jgi:site-specific recombinase XerD